MKLQRPTDFEILETLEESGRNVASNIAILADKNRNYVNTRLPVLEDYGLVEKIGPSERSGLYEITERGRVVIDLRDEYDDADDFDQLVDDELARREAQ